MLRNRLWKTSNWRRYSGVEVLIRIQYHHTIWLHTFISESSTCHKCRRSAFIPSCRLRIIYKPFQNRQSCTDHDVERTVNTPEMLVIVSAGGCFAKTRMDKIVLMLGCSLQLCWTQASMYSDKGGIAWRNGVNYELSPWSCSAKESGTSWEIVRMGKHIIEQAAERSCAEDRTGVYACHRICNYSAIVFWTIWFPGGWCACPTARSIGDFEIPAVRIKANAHIVQPICV